MPDITPDTPRKDITVQGIILSAPMPYDEGHPLTANEAAVVNQTWLENLRNNFAQKLFKWVKDNYPTSIKVDPTTEVESLNGELEAGALAALQKEFDAYVDGYEFGVRGGGRGAMDPIMALALSIAEERVRDALKKQGYKLVDVREQIRPLAEKAISDNPAFMDEAKKIHTQRQEAASQLTINLPASD